MTQPIVPFALAAKAAPKVNPGSEQSLREVMDVFANQLCVAVSGNFDFTVHAANEDETAQKLGMLINFVLDAARRGLSELEQRNAHLAELDRLKSDFLANVSHELRTPLTLVLGPLESLIAGQYGPLPEQAHHSMERMQRNAARLAELVNDLLDFSKLEAGKTEVNWQYLNAAAIVSGIIEDARPIAHQRRINLNSQIVDGMPHTHLDRRMFEKIVLNLVSNALKFTPAGGSVQVRLNTEGDTLTLEVQDNGVGIPLEKQSHLFQRFHQIDTSATRQHEGTGLGLALVKEFAQIMHGEVSLESEVGCGALFQVRLPLRHEHPDSTQPSSPALPANGLPADGEAAPSIVAEPLASAAGIVTEELVTEDEAVGQTAVLDGAALSDGALSDGALSDGALSDGAQSNPNADAAPVPRYALHFLAAGDHVESASGTTAPAAQQDGAWQQATVEDTAPSTVSKPRILLAEDNADMRGYIHDLLKNEWHVTAVNNGREALDAMQEGNFAVVLSDVMMPEMDGFDLTVHLKRDPNLRHIPVILLTARAGSEAVSAGLECGADDYLAKPFGPTELRARVRAAWRMFHMYQELQQSNAALQRSNQDLQEFAHVASHDLQEPLRKVQAFGNLLDEEYGEVIGEDGRLYLQRMQNASNRMQNLISDLLTLAHVSSKVRPFVLVNLQKIVKEVISDLETRIQETGGRVEVGTLPTIEADPVQMHQLFQNLIGNALKFHRPDERPLVQVSSECGPRPDLAAGLCRLVVRDNGIGFDEKYASLIFATFQRLHGRANYEGTGVGLSICRKIVERHGGNIMAGSQVGQGATFTVTLPQHSAHGGPMPVSNAAAPDAQ